MEAITSTSTGRASGGGGSERRGHRSVAGTQSATGVQTSNTNVPPPRTLPLRFIDVREGRRLPDEWLKTLRDRRLPPPPRPPGAAWLDLNCRGDGFPFAWGALCAPFLLFARHLPLFTAVVAATVALKRRSALRPGGRIHGHNRRAVRKALGDKKRRMRDLLKDPVLVRDMERRYGDISSLRQSVERWELDGFAIQKKDEEDYMKSKGLPWIRTANRWLSLILFLAMYASFSAGTLFVVLMCLAHLVDNVLLQWRCIAGAGGRGNKKTTRGTVVVAAVGVPVPEADVGIPMEEGIVTV